MIDVAMGIIFSDEGKILIAKRDITKKFGGLWEFPGGKREYSEPIETTLVRELQEELGVKVDILGHLTPYLYQKDGMNIRFYPLLAQIVNGILKAEEHEELEYVNIEEISKYELAPPDYEAVDMLRERMEPIR